MDSFSNNSHTSRSNRPPIPLLPYTSFSIPSSTYPPTNKSSSPAPRRIPKEKLNEAAELYARYLAAKAQEALEERSEAASLDAHLHPYKPANPPPQSTTSHRSSNHPLGDSGPPSEYDARTDISSVVDFNGNKKPSKANSVSFEGKVVKRSTRKSFTPVERLKTHLIRLLTSCPECRLKKTTCTLDHHDIDTLKRIIERRRSEAHSRETDQSGSATSNSSQRTARSNSGGHGGTSGGSQSDFLHMGAQLSPSVGSSDTMGYSTGGDILAEDVPGFVFTSSLYRVPQMPDSGTELYRDYGQGSVILIGIQQNEVLYCQHRSGCQQPFQDAEELQDHFAADHFAFNRIYPAVKHICLSCKQENNLNFMRCRECNMHDSIQTQVHGHFMRSPEISLHPGSGPAPIQYYSSMPYFPAAYATSVNDAETGPSHDSGNGNNMDSFVDHTPDSGPYGGTSDQAYNSNGFNYYNDTTMGGHYQGNYYRGARQMALKHSAYSRALYSTAQRHSRLLLLAVLLVVLILCLAHDEITSKVRTTFPQAGPEIRERLPTIGFIILFISFGTSFLVKHRIRPISTQSQHPCTLRALAPYVDRCRPMSPSIHIKRDQHL